MNDEGTISLRPVTAADLDAIFAQMRDPESVRMAAFTPEDPDDRDYFDRRMTERLADPELTMLAILRDGDLVGTIGAFFLDGRHEITYWVDRAWWGRGVATRALARLLELVPDRPLWARIAADNAGSRRVLEKVGFRAVGTDVGFANARGAEIEEIVLRLDPRPEG